MSAIFDPFDQATLDDVDGLLREVASTGRHQLGVRALRRSLEYARRTAQLTAEFVPAPAVAAPAPVERPRGRDRCTHTHPQRGRCTETVGHRKGRGGGHHYLDEQPVSDLPATVPAPRRFHEGLPSMAG